MGHDLSMANVAMRARMEWRGARRESPNSNRKVYPLNDGRETSVTSKIKRTGAKPSKIKKAIRRLNKEIIPETEEMRQVSRTGN